MKRSNNYALAQERAAAYFLSFSQEELIQKWKLSCDENRINLRFLCKEYYICRKTGNVFASDGSAAGYDAALSIYDLLCHEGQDKKAAGRYAPVNSLGIRYVGVDTGFYQGIATEFDRNFAEFQAACLRLGGQVLSIGDVGFRFPIFADLKVQLKFYRGDEEFPASLTLLWDENTLQFVHYETVFYMAGVLLNRIRQEMAMERR